MSIPIEFLELQLKVETAARLVENYHENRINPEDDDGDNVSTETDHTTAAFGAAQDFLVGYFSTPIPPVRIHLEALEDAIHAIDHHEYGPARNLLRKLVKQFNPRDPDAPHAVVHPDHGPDYRRGSGPESQHGVDP